MHHPNAQDDETVADSFDLAVLIPVFEDWESLQQLIIELARVFEDHSETISIFAVNDGSISRSHQLVETTFAASQFRSVEILNLPYNMGHQRAIALGLAELSQRDRFDAVVILDADGEDRPSDVSRLIASYRTAPNSLIVAQRRKRSEGPVFGALYSAYKLIFRILTGQNIDFGNFSLIPREAIDRLANTPETWNNLAAAYVRSPIQIVKIATERGTRYAGHSKMNLPSLVLHAIGAISVFADILFARVLIASSVLAILSLIGIGIVFAIRILTDWAVPGWATTSVGFLGVFFLQVLILMMCGALLLMNSRSLGSVTPLMQRKRIQIGRQVVSEWPIDRIEEHPISSLENEKLAV